MESEIKDTEISIDENETSVEFNDTVIPGVLDFPEYNLQFSKNTDKNDPGINKSLASKFSGSSVCPECKHTFSYRKNFKRHIKNQHPALFPTLFSSIMATIRPHNGYESSKNTNKTDLDINKSLASKFNGSCICPECKQTFSYRSNFKRHIKNKHSNLFPTLYSVADKSPIMPTIRSHTCNVCEKKFKSIKSLQGHRRRSHKLLVPKKLHKCPLCSQMLKRIDFNEHFEKSHNMLLKHIKLNFNSYGEFCEWKKAIERITKSYFSKEHTQIFNGTIHYMFICHRSGTFISKVNENKRKLKSQGSRKINAFCPATMKAVVLKDGRCEVKFQSQHVGHENELQHLNLTHDERKYVANKLVTNSPLNDILNDIRNSALKEGAERLSQITRNDLYNIKLSLLKKDNQFYSFETESDQKLSNDLRDIHNKHAESEKIRADITKTEKGWLLTFIEHNEICLIKENFKSCDCTLVCIYCRVCIKSYSCSCSDSSVEGNMCKHIHFFCMEQNKMLDVSNNKDSIDSNNDEKTMSSEQCSYLEANNKEPVCHELLEIDMPRIISINSEKISTLKNKFCDLIDSLTTEEEYKLSESAFEELTAKLKSIQDDSADKDNTDIPVANNLSKSVCDSTKKQDQHNLHSSKIIHTPLLLEIPKPSGEGVKLYTVSISLQQKKDNV